MPCQQILQVKWILDQQALDGPTNVACRTTPADHREVQLPRPRNAFSRPSSLAWERCLRKNQAHYFVSDSKDSAFRLFAGQETSLESGSTPYAWSKITGFLVRRNGT